MLVLFFKDSDIAPIEPFEFEPIDFFAIGIDKLDHDCVNVRIGKVYEKMGLDEHSKDFYRAYADYCQNEQSIYKSASLAMKYANEGEIDLAIEQLNIFAKQDDFQYWMLVYLKIDPLLNPLKDNPVFDDVMQKIEDRFWENQSRLKESLEEKELI